jgi:hypothetical protein
MCKLFSMLLLCLVGVGISQSCISRYVFVLYRTIGERDGYTPMVSLQIKD